MIGQTMVDQSLFACILIAVQMNHWFEPPGYVHSRHMATPDSDTIENIIALAKDLPDPYRRQLLELIGSWRDDIRQSPRQTYHELLNFKSDNGSHYGQARDISGTGLFITTPASFSPGDHLELILTFISAPNPVHLSGTVVRKTDEGIGVQFDKKSRDQVSELETVISKHALILQNSSK